MIITKHDLKIARFPSIEEVKKNEVEFADIVVIDNFISTGIYHSKSIRWKGNLSSITQPEDMIRSKKERKALAENQTFFENQGYEIKVIPVTEQLFNDFVRIYNETTLQKKRASIYNLKEQILSKILSGIPAYFIGLFKDNSLISALAFSIKNEEAVVSVSAKRKFSNIRGGIGSVFEYELVKFCLDNSIKSISHGISNNPAGVYDNSGIFEFKSRYGFSAFPEGEWMTSYILTDKVAISDVIFVSTANDHLVYQILTNEDIDITNKYKTKAVPYVNQINLTAAIKGWRHQFGV